MIVPPSCLPVLAPSYRPLLPLTRAEPPIQLLSPVQLPIHASLSQILCFASSTEKGPLGLQLHRFWLAQVRAFFNQV